tara:strand:- start:237 stop:728 length:492 start_codon:yes stop_codon:yes gene_type:complete
MVWQKVDTNTLTVADDIILLNAFTPLNFNQILMHCFPNSADTIEPRFKLNADATGHASRTSRNGAADTTAVSRGDWVTSVTDAADTNFNVGYWFNPSGEEQLSYVSVVSNNGNGAGNAPQRREVYSKYTDGGSNAQVTQISNMEQNPADLKGVGSNFTVLGTD